MGIQTYQDSQGHWRWRLRADDNRILADSGVSYRALADCLDALDLAKAALAADPADGPAPHPISALRRPAFNLFDLVGGYGVAPARR